MRIALLFQEALTLESRFFSLRRKSASSGDVMRIMFSLTTIMLANSKSCTTSESNDTDIMTDVVLLQYLSDRPENPFGVEMKAKLSDNQASSCFEQASICTK